MNEAVGSIAVVIAVRNEAERLPLLLADLQKGELPLSELVVVEKIFLKIISFNNQVFLLPHLGLTLVCR